MFDPAWLLTFGDAYTGGSDVASAGKRKAESPAPDAECARIYQRLSLGESTAELMARAKALRCR